MIVAVHQPNYLPYLGFFHKMAHSDVFVLYDTAQYSRNELHNRNRIKTARGVEWITVPVHRPRFRAIKDVEIAVPTDWAEKHRRTFEANYRRAPYYDSYAPELHAILRGQWHHLAELNEALIQIVARWLSIATRTVRSSALPDPPSLDSTDKLLHFTEACNGDAYLSGPGGRGYLKEQKFESIRLQYTNFASEPYPQLFGEFVPNLSVVDAVFNCGDDARRLVV